DKLPGMEENPQRWNRNCPDTELTPDHLFCPSILWILQRKSDCPQENLYSDKCLDFVVAFAVSFPK
ncbi:hypothetical protein TNIN_216851, partial [Trichonephila inaurata madagascariensis]